MFIEFVSVPFQIVLSKSLASLGAPLAAIFPGHAIRCVAVSSGFPFIYLKTKFQNDE